MYRRIALMSILFLAGLSKANGQFFNMNPPVITGQRPTPLVVQKNSSIAIAFQNLRVSDPDIFVPAYPQGYTLSVFPGQHYTVLNTTVTPDPNFIGTLTVQVMVNDGKFDSNLFDLSIDVANERPVITGHDPITFKEGKNFTLLLSHLDVEDADNTFPTDFSLTVYDGPNYQVSGTTITPESGVTGDLPVTVTVSDGHAQSDNYEVIMEVKPNIVPVIKNQAALSVNQGKKITIEFGNLVVDDADNSYPADFTLSLHAGPNYTLNDHTITPHPTFAGLLRVPVTVHDGLDESNRYELKIDVIAKNNVKPEITSQDALGMDEDGSLTIRLDHLNVTDPDNVFPDDFVLKIKQGAGLHYSIVGTTLTPEPDYNGVLVIPVRVSDGLDDSDPFSLSITVNPVNDIPVITGQREIIVRSNRSTTLDITRLDIVDPDSENTSSFVLRILPGTNYTSSGSAIQPATDFVGTLTAPVVVNDGVVDSEPFNLIIEVVPGGSAPLITGQQPLVMDEDQTIRLKLENIFVTDDDDEYPVGFSMKVLPGEPRDAYTVQGLSITPKTNFNGVLTVYVSVNDGDEESQPFALTIYVVPVNDPPEITDLESIAVSYEPGTGPSFVTQSLTIQDVDSEYITFAEIAFVDSTFNPLHDVLIFENTEKIRGVYDRSKGILSLIGSALSEDYDSALRSIQYNYELTTDEQGNHHEVLPGRKAVRFAVSDGQFSSANKYRLIQIETDVQLSIPNAFTPNGDNANDVWQIRPTTNAAQFDKATVRVYDRKGSLVYEGKGFEKSWDGTFNGQSMPPGTYFYTIDLNLSYSRKTYKGIVTILR